LPTGENFALMSGTSMAAPHVAGLAALIRQKFPNFSPAAIGSALSTTASLYDKSGGPIMAQRSYASPDQNQSPATPFDMGSGFVNASGALNPGLVFDSGKSLKHCNHFASIKILMFQYIKSGMKIQLRLWFKLDNRYDTPL